MQYKNEYPGIIHFEQRNNMAVLTFDNVRTLNALSYDIFASMDQLFDMMTDDEDVWGVILTGAGRAFVAGADLKDPKLSVKDPSKIPAVDRRESLLHIHTILNKVADFPGPVIAAVNGYALGGGAELGLCCDFRIGSTKAKVGFPEGILGGMPGYTGPSRAVRVLGLTAAKEMIYDARHYTAEEALRLGYFSRIVEPEELMTTCEAFMARMLKSSPLSLKYEKIMCDRSAEMSLRSSLEFERLILGTLGTSEDWKEGMSAFEEKRSPVFKNH